MVGTLWRGDCRFDRFFRIITGGIPLERIELDATRGNQDDDASDDMSSLVCRMLALCVYGRWEQAETWFARGARLVSVAPGPVLPDLIMLRGSTCAVLADRVRGAQRWRHRIELYTSWFRLRHWARRGPDYVQMAELLQAELARARGGNDTALFEQAARHARAAGFRQHAALAHERLAALLLAGRRSRAATRLRERAVPRVGRASQGETSSISGATASERPSHFVRRDGAGRIAP